MSYTLAPNESPHLLHEQKTFQLNPSVASNSKENIELSYINLDRTCSRSQNPSDLPHHKSSAIHLSQRHQEKQRTPYGRLKRIVRNVWLTAFMPAVAFAYLSFCYVVATGIVPVRIYKVDQPLEHLYEIKAGVTTISIIIIATALLPVKSLLDDLKSEEFFRRLHTSQRGVPLEFLNNISTPSHSVFQGMFAVVRAQATKYYAGTILSGFIAAAVTSLAPAALSVGIIPVEGELSAFRVGAIGVDMTFKPLSYKHAVPIPLDLEPNTRARWVSDVIIMDPVCTWAVPDPPLVTPFESWNVPPESWNRNDEEKVNISLPTHGVGAQISLSDFPSQSKDKYITILASWDSALFNLTTKYPPTQGTLAWLVSQCTSCQLSPGGDTSRINFTGISTQEFKYPSISMKIMTEVTSLVSILVCNPRATIESREVRADGSGRVEVVESRPLVRQGNLHKSQTKLLLFKGLTDYTSNSGPSTTYFGIGQAAQIQLFFGKVGNATGTTTLTPLPIDKLTEGYALAQQAVMRSYLSGEIASSYVPGRIQTLTLVFTSSLPHVIVSTILFAFLTLFINVCFLRSDAQQFTLLSVAVALAHSDVPAVCEEIQYADQTQSAIDQDVMLKSLRGRHLYLAETGGPGESLRLG
ncbi:hypothetical protein BDV93DRAFT_566541 [Ceratobasidium sp. AG-I]|nr:hypothetical protein BDV93DRAFT_566541 [Ceratobasidium sp. AG-I]